MVHSIELSFDPALDAAVRAEWAALEAAGLPSMTRHGSPTNRPHVTLLAAVSLPALAVPGLPFPVRLGAVACFPARPGEVVLVRIVVPSAALLSVHAGVAAQAGGLPGVVPYVAPGDWTPHVTLARRFPLAAVGDAVTLLGRADHLTGHATRADHWNGDTKALTPLAP